MRPESMADQAAGLRRILAHSSARVVTVTAAHTGFGVTSVVVNLAVALAQAGKNVLVLDQNLPTDNVGSTLLLKPRHDLPDAVRCGISWPEIVLQHQSGVRMLPVARVMQTLRQLSAPERKRLLECLAEVSSGADIILVDSVASPAAISMDHAQPLLIVLNATSQAITESYALIKRMARQHGRQKFLVVVNKVRNAQEAQAVFSNIAQVARHHLQVRVEYMGCIPQDENLQRAAMLSVPVLEAFPATPSAMAFSNLGRNLMLLSEPANSDKAGQPNVIQGMLQQLFSPNVAHAN